MHFTSPDLPLSIRWNYHPTQIPYIPTRKRSLKGVQPSSNFLDVCQLIFFLVLNLKVVNVNESCKRIEKLFQLCTLRLSR